MSVDDWARKQAEKRYPATWQDRGRTDRDDERDAFKEGVGALADALLSDEAVEAAYWADMGGGSLADARAALQAAIDAVTKEARNDGALAHEKHAALRALQAAVDAVTKEARND